MFKKISKISFVSLLFLVILIFAVDSWVKESTQSQLFTSTDDLPKHKVGLLLGTGKYLKSGRVNLYYTLRLDAAEQLFKSEKIEYLLLSGDNGRTEYDEPTDMKEDLIARGIPEEKIFLDYAGFRTLDSVVRAKAIFGQSKFTIISQPFHNERAVFLANQKGLETVGFNAQDVATRYGWKVMAREKLARVKMLLDILIGKQPKFYGEEIPIP